jgi:hypothetical protein
MLEQSAGVLAGSEDPGLGPGGVPAQAHRTAVAAPPFLIDQIDKRVWGGAGEFFQRGAHSLGDQLEPGQVAHGGQHMGGIGALGSALTHQSGIGEPGQSKIEQAVSAVTFSEPVTEIAQHAVVETGVVQLQAECVLEIDTTAHGLGRLPIRQIQHVLQHAHGGRLSRGQTRPPITRIPASELLVAP